MDELHEFLVRCLAAHREWIIVTADGRSFPVANSEIELDRSRNRLMIGFPLDQGFENWRIADLKTAGVEIRLDLTRDLGRRTTRIRLIPRASFSELQTSVELARLETANRVAALLARSFPRSKVRRAALNRENGRFAQIEFSLAGAARACIADVTDSLTPEFLMSAACFWLAKLERRKKYPARSVMIIAGERVANALSKLHALLRADWKQRVTIVAQRADGELEPMAELVPDDLWGGKIQPVRLPSSAEPSEIARQLIKLAPDEIDAVFARNGETIRFHGLAFARIRRLFGAERAWFGTERHRRPLTSASLPELAAMIDELREFRRHGSPNRRHAFYETAPEAWLESRLRRDIHRLDANLILSPVYHQFRADRDKIDLLALRRDGRLVIIELKVEPDREVIFQTVDYWRKIERIRRAGALKDARLFGDLEIADAPAICYLVAPTLAFHRDFDFSASLVSREVEIHRFNLAEDWRRRIRVLERRRAV